MPAGILLLFRLGSSELFSVRPVNSEFLRQQFYRHPSNRLLRCSAYHHSNLKSSLRYASMYCLPEVHKRISYPEFPELRFEESELHFPWKM